MKDCTNQKNPYGECMIDYQRKFVKTVLENSSEFEEAVKKERERQLKMGPMEVITNQSVSAKSLATPFYYYPNETGEVSYVPMVPVSINNVYEPRNLGGGFFELNHCIGYKDKKNLFCKITNFEVIIESFLKLISVKGEVELYLELCLYNSESREEYICKLDKYRNLKSKLESDYLEFVIFENGNAAAKFKEYLSMIYTKAKKNVPVKTKYSYCGWSPLHNGIRKFVKNSQKELFGGEESNDVKIRPTIGDQNKEEIVRHGLSFLEIAPLAVSLPILLYESASLMAALFADAEHPLKFLLMLVGESGAGKTMVAREVFSPFIRDKDSRKNSLLSTGTALEILRESAIDDALLIDDLCHSTGKGRQQNEVFEDLLRALSDNSAKSRSDMTRTGIKKYAIRGGTVVTAENLPKEIFSSTARYVRINVDKATFCENKLTEIQNNPYWIPEYFSLFIYYLEQNYASVVSYIRKNFDNRRSRYKGNMVHRRLVDSAVQFELIVDVMMSFASFYGWENKNYTREVFYSVLRDLMIRQSLEVCQAKPYILYLQALYQLLGNGHIHVASNIDDYVRKLSSFDGYYDGSFLWLKHENVRAKIKEYYMQADKEFSVLDSELYGALKENRISITNTGSNLKKASSKIPHRPLLLVINDVKAKKAIGLNEKKEGNLHEESIK